MPGEVSGVNVSPEQFKNNEAVRPDVVEAVKTAHDALLKYWHARLELQKAAKLLRGDPRLTAQILRELVGQYTTAGTRHDILVSLRLEGEWGL